MCVCIHLCSYEFDWGHRNEVNRLERSTCAYVPDYSFYLLPLLLRIHMHAASNDNISPNRSDMLSLAASVFGFASSRLCCAKPTRQHADPLGDHLSPDLAVYFIHYNLRFDVPERLHHVFMLSMPSWNFLGLCQVRSLVGGQGPMTSDARRYSIKMSLSYAIAYQSG